MRTKMLLATLLLSCATTSTDPRAAAPAPRVEPAMDAVHALIEGRYAEALARADRQLAARGDDAWLLYNRGVALVALGRLDEGFASLRRAEARFDSAHEKSLAIYRRALALEFAGRCAEASTEYSRYAAMTRATEPKLAGDAIAHLRFCITPGPEQLAEREERARLERVAADDNLRRAEAASTRSVYALADGDYWRALDEANDGLEFAPDDAWLLYNRGAALAGVGYVDDAIETLRRAEQLFAAGNLHGRSVATYRRAIALEIAGRCDEAGAELRHYADLMTPTEPALAQHALTHLKFCRAANGRTTF
jgi:tetratricopeptide (TPR) repeat protein